MEETYVSKSGLRVSRGFMRVRSYDSDSHQPVVSKLQKNRHHGINFFDILEPTNLTTTVLVETIIRKAIVEYKLKRNEYVIVSHVCINLSKNNIVDMTKASHKFLGLQAIGGSA